MTTYSSRPINLAESGVLIAVQLCAPSVVSAPQPPIDTLAEIDTGILITRIQEGVATSLGLEPTGTVKITSATTHTYETYLFRIRIAFPEGNMAFEVDAVEVPYMSDPRHE
jgi:hypothetical protein